MDGTYSIYSAEEVVGTAKVTTEGLYYHFQCECRLEQKQLCKICVYCGDDTFSLGIPVPDEALFSLRKKIPIKKFGAGEWRFAVVSSASPESAFFPVQTDMPFPYMKYLKFARFQVHDGVPGIVMPKGIICTDLMEK